MEPYEKARRVYDGLIEMYGEPLWKGGEDPLHELIWTILSANTNDRNSARAYRQLLDRFQGDWDAIRLAPLDAVKEAIRPAGMYNQKAPNIVATLERVKADWGGYDLGALATMGAPEGLAYLTSLPGVGHKTASIVLLFCYNLASFPVDTHVQRISRRLGFGDSKASPEKIKRIWETLLPPETFYALHVNLIRHGRERCRARSPRCDTCALQPVCEYFQVERKAG
jgi:endonuclease III